MSAADIFLIGVIINTFILSKLVKAGLSKWLALFAVTKSVSFIVELDLPG